MVPALLNPPAHSICHPGRIVCRPHSSLLSNVLLVYGVLVGMELTHPDAAQRSSLASPHGVEPNSFQNRIWRLHLFGGGTGTVISERVRSINPYIPAASRYRQVVRSRIRSTSLLSPLAARRVPRCSHTLAHAIAGEIVILH